ncbi:MAG: methyl-accepting chemotaxis protein [Chitinispirillaceae bacterium]|nr:methyl-accepting chemotaxis protein [Chitinispirillaceae bacterium]
MMESRVSRKPIGNFFIKKALQIRLINRIVTSALIATIVTSGSLILVYFIKYQTIIVYQLDKLSQELSREHLIYLILPTLLFSAIVNLLISFGVGLYASRKYAVPIYKLEQWCNLLIQGKFSAVLRFREKEEMKDLSDKFNELSGGIRSKLLLIQTELEKIKKEMPEIASRTNQIDSALSSFELESMPIEVTTTFYRIPPTPESTK